MSGACGQCGKSKRCPRSSSVYSASDYGDDDDLPRDDSSITSLAEDAKLPQPQPYAAGDGSLLPIAEHDVDRHKFYRPTSHRTWVLSLFVVALAVSVLLLELAIAAHPSDRDVVSVGKRDAPVPAPAILWARQNAGQSSSEEADALSPVVLSPTATDTVTEQPPASDQLTITTASSPDPSPSPSPAPQSAPATTAAQPTPASTYAPAPAPTQTQSTAPTAESLSTSAAVPKSSSRVASSEPAPASPSSSSAIAAASTSREATSDTPTASTPSSTRHEGSDRTVLPANATSRTDNSTRTTTTMSTGAAASATGAAAQDGKGGALGASDNSPSKQGESHFTSFQYFLAMYLPTLIAVALQSAWLIVYSAFKMMEPFYQLARPGGALGAMTLTADYGSSGLSLNFVKAALGGHGVMLSAGVIHLGLTLIVTLASDAMSVKATAFCKTDISDRQPCNPVWVVNVGIVRAIEVFLILCLVLILAVAWMNRRRSTGVMRDPSSIATMADLLVQPSMIQELRDLPPEATKRQIQSHMGENRYMLGTFEFEGHQKYGILKLEDRRAIGAPLGPPKRQAAFHRVEQWAQAVAEMVDGRVWGVSALTDIACLTLTAVLFSIILAYWCVKSGAFNDWMNRGDVGPSIFLTTVAVLVAFWVKRKEELLRRSHPYVLLATPPSKLASDTITRGTRGTPFTSVLRSFQSQDLSLALMSSAAILSDMLLIMIPGVPFTHAQTSDVYKAITWICLLFLVLIFAAQAWTTYADWQQERSAYEEGPDTLAAGLLRLCASRFVEHKNIPAPGFFEKALGPAEPALEFGDDYEQKQRLRYEGVDGRRRYHFAWMQGVDGVNRWTVDEDLSH